MSNRIPAKTPARFFHGGEFKILPSSTTDAIIIQRKQSSGRYAKFDEVSGTNDNVRAAVKRINRAVEREKLTASVVAKSVKVKHNKKPSVKSTETTGSKTSSVLKPPLPLEKKIKADMDEYAQSAFKLDSNIPGIKREYLIRRVKRTVVAGRPVIEVSLFLIANHLANHLILIKRIKDPNAVSTAIALAREDAKNLKPVNVLVMSHCDKSPEADGEINQDIQTLAIKQTVFLSTYESSAHVKTGLELVIKKYFSKFKPRIN